MTNVRKYPLSVASFTLRASGIIGCAMASASCTQTEEQEPVLPGSGSAGGAAVGTTIPGSTSLGATNPAAGKPSGAAPEGAPNVGRDVTGGSPASGGTIASDAGSRSAPLTGCWTTRGDGSVALDGTDKVVLFDGTDLSAWKRETGGPAHWTLLDDGTLEVSPAEPPTDLQTVQGFEDLCLHVEYQTPPFPSSVTGQDRGNSGIYLKSAYELQILDSIGKPPAIDSCGAVYEIQPPLAVACNPEQVWNTYEIEFAASRWSGDVKTENASFVLVTLNGIVVQRNVPLNPAGGATRAGNPDRPGPEPLLLQDHRNRVKFRNIWVKVPRP